MLEGSRRMPPLLTRVQKLIRTRMAHVIAGNELNTLRRHIETLQRHVDNQVGGIQRELELIRYELDGAVMRATPEILKRDDAVHLAQERRIAAVANRILRLEERLGSAHRATTGPAHTGDGGEASRLLAIHDATAVIEARRYDEFRRQEQTENRSPAPSLVELVERIRELPPVLDISWRGAAMLELLHERGIGSPATQRPSDQVQQEMMAAVSMLHRLYGMEAASVGAITALELVEHLGTEEADVMLRLAHRALGPGGLLLLTTLNPSSLHVVLDLFPRDPLHVRPYHREGLRLLVENAGFEPIAIVGLSPVPRPAAKTDVARGGFRRSGSGSDDLQLLLDADERYAVLARKSG